MNREITECTTDPEGRQIPDGENSSQLTGVKLERFTSHWFSSEEASQHPWNHVTWETHLSNVFWLATQDDPPNAHQ